MKEPFTSAGLDDKITALYLLSDSDLEDQASAVVADFATWVDDNFQLDSYQFTYLSSIPATTLKTWGYLYAAAFMTRGAISMATPPPNPPPRRTKEARKNVDAKLSYNDDDEVLEGSVSISIEWELLPDA